jgi:hypothetical protein
MFGLQKANQPTVNAEATTREEFMDNLYHIIKAWEAKTKDPFMLSYDNAKIQSTADIHTLYHPDHQGEDEWAIELDPAITKLSLPPYSHDLNRPIEHVFGTMKHRIREALYFERAKYTTPTALHTLVWDQFHTNIPEKHVERDVKGLPELWRVLSTPMGITFQFEDGRLAVGTGGNWPNAEYR